MSDMLPEHLIPLTAREAFEDALDEFNDAGLTSGTAACEHYLCAIATLVLWEFRHRHDAGDYAPPMTKPVPPGEV